MRPDRYTVDHGAAGYLVVRDKERDRTVLILRVEEAVQLRDALERAVSSDLQSIADDGQTDR